MLVVELDRMTSHTNSDDHRVYRSQSEIAAMALRDPVEYLERAVLRLGRGPSVNWSCGAMNVTAR